MPGSTTIARGNIIAEKLIAVTITPTAVAPFTSAEQAFTVLGVQSGDYANVNFNGLQTPSIVIANCRVTGANTVAIAFTNVTAVPMTPAPGLYGIIWGRPENLPLDTNVV
jgi:hypothetical protein